jgi:hypothetical protein
MSFCNHFFVMQYTGHAHNIGNVPLQHLVAQEKGGAAPATTNGKIDEQEAQAAAEVCRRTLI